MSNPDLLAAPTSGGIEIIVNGLPPHLYETFAATIVDVLASEGVAWFAQVGHQDGCRCRSKAGGAPMASCTCAAVSVVMKRLEEQVT